MAKLIYTMLLSVLIQNAFFSQTKPATSSDLKGTLKVNFNLSGKNAVTDVFYNDSLSNKQNIDLGYSLSAELTGNITEFLSIGAGVAYQFQRKGSLLNNNDSLNVNSENMPGKKIGIGKFGYIPVYAIVELNFIESDIITPCVIGHFGYNLFFGNDDYKGDLLLEGGGYYAVGIRLGILENYLIDVLYEVNQGGVSFAEKLLFDTKYSYMTVSLGINF